jgi:hypothetical protein
LHVLSTPPAFVLSQDQTLRRCIQSPAENRELALSISINQRNPSHDYTSRGTGYYLALTFGTLLSSQRADAQKPDPHGPRSLAGCPTLRRFPVFPHPGPGPADLPVRAAQREHYTISEALAQGPRVASVSRSSPRRQDRRGLPVQPAAGSGTSRALCLLGHTVAALKGQRLGRFLQPGDAGRHSRQRRPRQRPRKLSMPTVRPGRPPTSRTARRTPGMNEARS